MMNNKLPRVFTGVALATVMAALTACNSSNSRVGNLLNRNKEPAAATQTAQAEETGGLRGRFSKFRDRVRSIGGRDSSSQQLPDPVGVLAPLNPPTTAIASPSRPLAPMASLQSPQAPQSPMATMAAPMQAQPSGPTEAVNAINWSDAGTRDYNGQYQADQVNKAFAVSPGGSYGVSFGYNSSSEAEAQALAECRKDVQPGSLDCVIFDVNGQIVLTFPRQVSRR